ncbi:MAG: OB-fold domain-containing protein [Hyphomonadaceae bacterium]|nr:OB-fold domain-containing protein [Hyphomonadaceae bacterium]
MSAYLPAGVPLPAPDPWEAPFWDFCNNKELRFQACAKCGAVRHPPAPTCPQCLSGAQDWIAASDDAELFTYTIIHHANHPALKAVVPYNAAVVVFPALGHVRLVTNIVGDAALRIGMPLTLVWESPAPGRWLPRFAPRTVGGAR